MTSDLHCTFWAYPWDFLDEGPAVAASRIRATGVDAVSVAAVYHPVDQIRPHLGGSTLVQSETTAWFPPDLTRYRETPLSPPFPDRSGMTDPFARIADACVEARLELNAWVVCCHAITLGRRHPELCQCNVLGDTLLASLCPSQPAVQAYLQALIRDVADRYPIRRFELEALQYMTRWPETPHEKNGLPFGPVEQYLRGLCVCPACKTRARNGGVDVNRTVATAKTLLQRLAETGEPLEQPLAVFVAEHPEIGGYHRARRETLLDTLRACCGAGGLVPSSTLLSGNEYTSGLRPSDTLAAASLLTVLFYAPPAVNLRSLEKRSEIDGVAPDRLLASLIAFGPNCPDAGSLKENLVEFVRRGVRHFSFYNYGALRLAQLDWVRGAIDAARAAS